jgi:KDO2-lipid IV(A) lauroyltransferase
MNKMNRIEHGLYSAVDIFLRIVGCLPSGARQTCAAVLGTVGYKLAKRHRRIAIGNLTTAFGREKSSDDIHKLARQAFVNMVRMVFEIGWSLRLPESSYPHHFTYSGLEHYHRAKSRERGVLLLGAHFSNWEFYPVMAHMAGVPMTFVYRPLDARFMDAYMKDLRTRFGAGTISTRRGAMAKIYKSLNRGHAVGLLMDQGADFDNGVFVDFFNRRAATNVGMALLALKSGAPVVPFFLERTGQDRFHAAFGPELPLIKTGDRTKDIEANTQQYNDAIEAYARKYPDQWFWVHNRWKNLPFCPWPRTNPKVSNRY